MTDTSSDSLSRPPQLSSYTPPSDMSSGPPSAPLRSPLTPGGSQAPFSGPTSRPSSGVGAPQGHPYSLPPPTSPRTAAYRQSQYYGLSNPQGVQLSGYQDMTHPHAPFIGGHDSTINSLSSSAQGQKRAYRQRRKDPSCDACRERKVKCDATENSSCTECTSRSVRCQFTKDTNRRMTSLKHNQDLIKELARTKSELEKARIEAESGAKAAPASLNGSVGQLPGPDPDKLLDHGSAKLPGARASLSPQDQERESKEASTFHDERPTKRRRTTGPYDFSKIGQNMQRYGRGIFKAPHSKQLNPTSPMLPKGLPELPQKEIADALLEKYHDTIHPSYPVLDWNAFREQYDRIYQEGSLQNVPSIWVGMLFLVLALGALPRDEKETERYYVGSESQTWNDGGKYFAVSKTQIDLWSDDTSVDHARAAILSCMFMVEINMKSAAWAWLGIATRIAFDIALNCEMGIWSAIEEEMRRRVWWCIYSYDCLLSVEMGRPSMIKEQDCNVGMPRPTDDPYIRPDLNWTSPTPEQATSQLPSLIQTVNGISRLHQVFKIPSLTSGVISAYESHFTKLIDGLAAHREAQFRTPLNSPGLSRFIDLQNARLTVHRINLAPSCDRDSRSRALDGCATVAKETAKFLQRRMEDPRPELEVGAVAKHNIWQSDIALRAGAFFCTHLWRCMLFLCIRLDFQSALVCARASAAVPNTRPVNEACGRYLEFYLKELISRLNQGLSFDTNEEMIAYASGDLQGNFERSWVWQSTRAEDMSRSPGSSILKSEAESPVGETLQEGKWDNWGWVLSTLERLQRESQQPSPPTAYGRPGNARRISPPDAERLRVMAQSPEGQAARERMRIKDLI